MQRPTGVTIIAILCFLGAALCVGVALLAFAGGAFVASMLANTPGASGMAGSIGAIVGVFVLFFAVLYAATGYGLWALQNWGRIIAIVLVALGLIFGLLGLVPILTHMGGAYGMGSIVGAAIRIAISAWILWYLLQPHVKKAFGAA